MKSARDMIVSAAVEAGWGEDTQIEVLCQFIDSKETDFEQFLNKLLGDEWNLPEGTMIGDKLYVRSTTEVDDETGDPLYWNDEQGWVDFESATPYTQEQAATVDYLPADSKWC